ncbi:MAG: AsmA-like C-terminal region-containing protein [Deltaproteobacteria bacterium]|nr:AsmA-like C-terminal region-containing protein [Deltaproteobacteria bacterium]
MRKKIRTLLFLPLLLVLLFIAVVLLSNHLIQKPSVQAVLIKRISEFTGYEIRTSKIELNLWKGVGLIVQGLKARPERRAESLTASRVRIILDWHHLLRGRIVPSKIYLIQPEVQLPFAPGLPSGQGETAGGGPDISLFWIPGLQSISVERGRVRFTKGALDLEELFLEVREKRADPLALRITSRGKVFFRFRRIPFSLSGDISRLGTGTHGPFLNLRLETSEIPLKWIPWASSLPFDRGDLQARLRILGHTEGPFSIGGRILAEGVEFSLESGERTREYAIPSLSLDIHSIASREAISVPSLTLCTPDVSLSLQFKLDFNDSKRPRIDLEVTSAPMEIAIFKGLFPTPLLPAWLESRLFPLLRDGRVQLQRLALKGTPECLRSLDLPENRSALTMQVACRDFGVLGGGIQLPFEGVSAIVAYEEGDLLISKLKAGFGEGSSIREGSLRVTGLGEGERSCFEARLDGSFDLSELMKQKYMDILPPDVIRKLQELEPVYGELECQAGFRYEQGWPFPRTTNGRFLFRGFRIEQEALRFPLTLNRAEFLVREDGENRLECEGSWGHSSFEALGVFGDAEEGFPIQNATVAARVDMNTLIPVLLPAYPFPFTFSEPVACQISLKREGEIWVSQGRADLEGVRFETERFVTDRGKDGDMIFFDLRLRPSHWIDIRNLICHIKTSRLRLSCAYNLWSDDLLNLKVSIPYLSLNDIGVRFREIPLMGKGVLKGELEALVSRRAPSTTQVVGRLTGRALSLDLSLLPTPVRDWDFTWIFDGKKIVIPSCTLRTGQSSLSVAGELQGWDAFRGSLDVRSSFLDSRDVVPDRPYPSSPRNPGLERFLDTSRVRVSLDILEGRWRKLRWGPLQAELELRDGDLVIERSEARIPDGLLRAAGRIAVGKRKGIRLSSYVRVTDHSLEDLLGNIGHPENVLKGNLTLEALVFTEGAGRQDLLCGLAGNANILIREGVIHKSNVLIKVLDFLSLQKVFKERPPDLSQEEFYFESIGGHADIQEGILSTEDLVMKSPVLNAVASGAVDLPARTIDLTIGIQPLETIDFLVSNIPILGHILTGKDKTLLTYYFHAKGPFSGPEVSYVPFKNLGSGAAGILKRLFLAPVKLFKDLSEAARGRPDPGPSPSEQEGNGH